MCVCMCVYGTVYTYINIPLPYLDPHHMSIFPYLFPHVYVPQETQCQTNMAEM